VLAVWEDDSGIVWLNFTDRLRFRVCLVVVVVVVVILADAVEVAAGTATLLRVWQAWHRRFDIGFSNVQAEHCHMLISLIVSKGISVLAS
jgi:hypothetical protein